MIKKANGISEEARLAILDDIKAKVENGKDTINKSLRAHQ